MWCYCLTCHWMHLWKWLYPCITLSVKAINIWIIDFKVNCFRGRNPEHDMKNHLFSPNFRWVKIGGGLFGSPTTITHWFHIFKSWGLWPKHALYVQSRYILLYNLSYATLLRYIQNPSPYTTRTWYWSIEGWIQPIQERDGTEKKFPRVPTKSSSWKIIEDSSIFSSWIIIKKPGHGSIG